MKVLDAASMREAERKTIDEYGMPGILLMETAASRIKDFIVHRFSRDKRIIILSGPGNNGGDGISIARQLIREGYDALLCTTSDAGSYHGDAGINERYYRKAGLPVVNLSKCFAVESFREILRNAGLIVDALLGVGANREITGFIASIINTVNDLSVPVLSVDIPSGVDANTGAVLGTAVKADWTLTFACPKKGLLLFPGASMAGEVYVCDINIPEAALSSNKIELLTAPVIEGLMPERAENAHKGTMGRVLVLAGSPGMTGAALLASRSALRAGAGLVYLAVPTEISAAVEAKTLEIVTLFLPSKELDPDGKMAAAEILKNTGSCDAICIGPGMAADMRSCNMIKEIILHSKIPIVLDAGGLVSLKDDITILNSAFITAVITPHPGEMAKLTGISTTELQDDRIGVAASYARLLNGIVVLKGANTVIASPEDKISINPTGCNNLATAGTGDLLSGMIASFIAQGMNPYDASRAAVFIHGLAGDLLPPDRGYIASDILINYKKVFSLLVDISKEVENNPSLIRLKPLAGQRKV